LDLAEGDGWVRHCRRVAAEFRIDWTNEDDAIVTLATFINLATPVFVQFGYTPEEKGERSGKGWMHWNRGFGNVIRAYAFEDGDRRGVSILGQGEIPENVEEAVVQCVSESTNWNLVTPT
jgi:hypothetical protein